MNGKILNYSPKNKSIQIQSKPKDTEYREWYNVPDDMQTIFESTQKGQEIDFSYEYKDVTDAEDNIRKNKVLSKFSAIIPDGVTDKFVPANKPKQDYWDRREKGQIIGWAITSAISACSEFNRINNVKLLTTKTYLEDIKTMTKKFIEMSKEIEGE